MDGLKAASAGLFGRRRFRAKQHTNSVCHSPRTHSRPAIILMPPFSPFTASCCFCPLIAASEEQKQPATAKEKQQC
jgi:hypothetical protein